MTTIRPDQQAAHDDAVALGEAGYLDPDTGLFVMTAAYLLAKGACCESGCRHCPYSETVLSVIPDARSDKTGRGRGQ